MAKTLNEITIELKEYILDCLNDPRAKVKVKPFSYNSLNVSMDADREITPHVIVSLNMSEAIFNIHTGRKITGGLGPDERYVLKWLERGYTKQKLYETWLSAERTKRKNSKTVKPESKFR